MPRTIESSGHRVLPFATALLLVALSVGTAHSQSNTWLQHPAAPVSLWQERAFYEGPSQAVRIHSVWSDVYAYAQDSWSSYDITTSPTGNFVTVADPLGRRYLAISNNTVWELPRTGTAWSVLPVPGTRPAVVNSAVFDPVRNRAIVFGGGNELWQLGLDGAPAWSQIGTYFGTSGLPLYDPIGDRIVSVTLSTLWSLPLDQEPLTWTSQAIGGTQPRGTGLFVHDLRGHRLLTWGGGYWDCTFPPCQTVYTSGTHALNLAGAPHWTQLTTTPQGPGLRLLPTLAYDYVEGRMLVTGGYIDHSIQPDQPLYDTWTLQLGGYDPGFVDIDPVSVDFGGVPGPGTYQRTIEVSATGDVNSVIFAIVSSSPHVTVDARAFALAPGQSRVVTIDWDGTEAFLDATLQIECTDPASIKTIPVTGVRSPAGVDPSGERAFGLALAGRNPTTGPARLDLTMAARGSVEVTVHDLKGSVVRRLAEGVRDAGRHPLVWDGVDGAGRRAAAGVYFVRARTGGTTSRVKVVLSR